MTAEPDALRLVPVEPTREMWAAGGTAVVGYKQRHHDKVVEDVWSAMLAAAPGSESGGEVARLRAALEAERDWHEMRADYAFDAAREHSARGEKSDEKSAMNRHNLHMQRHDAINRALSPQPGPASEGDA